MCCRIQEVLYAKASNKLTFVIYKISDDKGSIVVEEKSSQKGYEEFLQKLTSSVDSEGNRAPRYAVYDVEYDLNEDGRRYIQSIRGPTMLLCGHFANRLL